MIKQYRGCTRHRGPLERHQLGHNVPSLLTQQDSRNGVTGGSGSSAPGSRSLLMSYLRVLSPSPVLGTALGLEPAHTVRAEMVTETALRAGECREEQGCSSLGGSMDPTTLTCPDVYPGKGKLPCT